MEKVTGNLHAYWGWIAVATYEGKETFHEVEYDVWRFHVRTLLFLYIFILFYIIIHFHTVLASHSTLTSIIMFLHPVNSSSLHNAMYPVFNR